MDERTKQLLSVGREHYEKRDYEEAEPYLKQVTDEGVRFADVFNMLGVVYHDAGRFDEAQAAFEEALQINPDYTEAALNLAVTYNDLGRYDDAKSVYEAAHQRGDEEGELDPFVKGKIANLHGELAQAYADASLVHEAIHELRKAILLCPEFPDLRLKLAKLHRSKGDLNAAHFELEEAVKTKPEYVPALVALGVVKLALGKFEGATVQWRAALKHDPENKTAKMYLKMSDNQRGGSMAPGAPDDSGAE